MSFHGKILIVKTLHLLLQDYLTTHKVQCVSVCNDANHKLHRKAIITTSRMAGRLSVFCMQPSYSKLVRNSCDRIRQRCAQLSPIIIQLRVWQALYHTTWTLNGKIAVDPNMVGRHILLARMYSPVTYISQSSVGQLRPHNLDSHPPGFLFLEQWGGCCRMWLPIF